MKEWFYDEYGIRIENVLEPFKIEDYIYNLVLIYDSKNISFLNDLCIKLASTLEIPPIEIIPNYQGKLISEYEHNEYVLIRGVEHVLTINQLLICVNSTLQCFQPISITSKRELWLKRSAHVEKEIVPWLPSEELSIETITNIRLAQFLGESAMAYLLNINPPYIKGGLSHTRISSLSSFEILNPVTIINDCIARDLVALFEVKQIDFEMLLKLIDSLNMSRDELIYFVARLLFPSRFYDFLEDMYVKDCSDNCKEYNFKEEYENKCILGKYIIDKYQLPIIDFI